MGNQRIYQSFVRTTPSQAGNSPFTARPPAVPARQNAQAPPTRKEGENEDFNRSKFEASGLQLQGERNSLIPVRQERLGGSQARMDDYWAQRLEKASRGSTQTTPEPENRTGLPDQLKAGVESFSGMSLDHVRVHYNSPKPAQVQSYAFAQGRDIHVAPGQAKHLQHEAWHVVQQAQGRVKPTRKVKDGVLGNDDQRLEHEADVMGAKAAAGAMQGGERWLAPHPDALERAETVLQSVKIPKTEYIGGDANESHIHQYSGGFHLKLGSHRFNIVQNGKVYAESLKMAKEALKNIEGKRAAWATEMLEMIDAMVAEYGGKQEESSEDEEDVKPGPSVHKAYGDPKPSKEGKALIEEGLSKGEYPPSRKKGKEPAHNEDLVGSSQSVSELLDDFKEESDQPPQKQSKKEAQEILDQQKPSSSQIRSKSPANKKKELVTPRESEKLKRRTGLTLSPGTLISIAVVLVALLAFYYGYGRSAR
jgi:hypothetical protein